MARRVFYIVLFALVMVKIMVSSTSAMRQSHNQPSQAHRAIAQETGWLNTSRPLTAEDLSGRIILLDFWTFCCINCIHVIPDLHFLEKKFGAKLTVIGVHSAKFTNEKDSANIRSAVLRYDIEHPVVNDADFKIWKSFGVRAWPTMVLINPDGHIEEIYSGEGNRDAIADDVERLTGKYPNAKTAALPLALEKSKQPESALKFPGKLLYVDDVSGKAALFISDTGHHRILGVRPETGDVFLRVGSGTPGFKDGALAEAQFHTPQGLVHKDGVLYVVETGNHALRAIDLSSGQVSTLAGTGAQGYERRPKDADAWKTPLASPWDLAWYPDAEHLAIAMAGTHQLWSYDFRKKTVSVLAGNGRESIDDGEYPHNSLSQPSGLAAYSGKLYFADSETSSLRVFENGKITTLIGSGLFDFGFADGKQGRALLQHPIGLTASGEGVYIADSYNHSIRKYDPESGTLSTVSGNGERGNGGETLASARYSEPNAIVAGGGALYVADTNNHAIRVLDLAKKTVRTLTIKELAAEDEPPLSAPQDSLPNVKPLPVRTLGNVKLTVELQLEPGWKINEEAPSWLAVFDTKEGKAVAYAGKEALRKGAVSIPALASGKHYRIQGTFYFCKDTPGAPCLIQSYDGNVGVNDDLPAANRLLLPLSVPE